MEVVGDLSPWASYQAPQPPHSLAVVAPKAKCWVRLASPSWSNYKESCVQLPMASLHWMRGGGWIPLLNHSSQESPTQAQRGLEGDLRSISQLLHSPTFLPLVGLHPSLPNSVCEHWFWCHPRWPG